ncbi:hypothetical protein Illi2_00195 [Pseudomonas phage vB_PpuM-Illi-2]
MSFSVTVAAQTIAAPESLGSPKGISVLEANEGFAVIEFQRPRASKRDQIAVPRVQILSLSHGSADGDSGYLIAQGMAGVADEFEAASFTIEGNVATFVTAEGATIETDARLTRILAYGVEEGEGSLLGAPKKKAGKEKASTKKK